MRASLAGTEQLVVQGRRPSLPAGTRIYAIGDVHGRLDLLDELLGAIDADLAGHPVARAIFVFLGDYIDRGNHSRETIDRLIERREMGEHVFLKGNHEQIALKCLSDPGLFDRWLRLGGTETLASHPAGMTHLSVPQPRKDALGIGDNLVRISIGVENADDLIADFDQALAAV